jgi:PTS system nitrogen regulatory IIA component
MDLKIKDVAQLLNVSETTIRRWLREGKIPAYRLNHQFRFSRIEIENWVMSCKMKNEEEQIIEPTQMVSLSEEKTKRIIGNQIGTQAYSLFRAINKGGILTNVDGKNKEEVIREAMKQIAITLNLDADVISDLLLDREKLMPTALNHGIGVPHARDFFLPGHLDAVTIVYPKRFIDYGSLDGEPVHTLFFLFACDDKKHLHLLAKIAHFTRDENALSLLKTRPSKEVLLEYVRKWESKISIYAEKVKE